MGSLGFCGGLLGASKVGFLGVLPQLSKKKNCCCTDQSCLFFWGEGHLAVAHVTPSPLNTQLFNLKNNNYYKLGCN